MDAGALHAQQRRLEQRLGTLEPLVPDGDGLAVRKLVLSLHRGTCLARSALLLKVYSHVAQLLLDASHDLAWSRRAEAVATLNQGPLQVVGQVPAGEVLPDDGVRNGEPLIDGNDVGQPLPGHEDSGRHAPHGVHGQHRLGLHEHGGRLERLEHHLPHLLAVALGVERGLGHEDRAFPGVDAQFFVEGVVPDLLHAVPVGDDAVLDRVVEAEDAASRLGLFPNVTVPRLVAGHHALRDQQQ